MRVWNLPVLRIGPLSEWEERRPAALVTTGPAWDAVKGRLRLSAAWRTEPAEATEAAWLAPLASLREAARAGRAEVVYAAGGGLAVDAAKYLAARAGLPLVGVPTALSADAPLTWASGVREGGCVRYLETKPPETLLVDWEVVAAAPPRVRAAGIADVLSIATGLWDWKFAEERGRNPARMRYLPWAADAARAILAGALECAEAAGRGDPAGLKRLLDCLAMEVQLCNLLGHSRPEEGSEHYFAYAAESLRAGGPPLPHGDLVGPGIVLMAERQGQDAAPLRRALAACGAPTELAPDLAERTLRELPAYARRHDLPYGIAHAM